MDDTAAPAPDDNDVVSCDKCAAPVRARATGPVRRLYNGTPFNEIWCLTCIHQVDENTQYAENRAQKSTATSEIGLDA